VCAGGRQGKGDSGNSLPVLRSNKRFNHFYSSIISGIDGHMTKEPQLVSIHGGHSGQFCNHAQDTLEAVIQAYIAKGFTWVGITEHMPPAADRFLYPEEIQAGLDARLMLDRFGRYVEEGRRLQEKYADRLEIFVGFETEAYTGAWDLAADIKTRMLPDYILGSVHHVADIPFDYSPEAYQEAVTACGGIEALYCRYFDLQHELILAMRPQVVAHFDLIRIFDAGYPLRWRQPAIARRIQRNLESIARMGLILEFNVAALRKGAAEPYLSGPLLEQALALGIPVVPADDSHGAAMAGAYVLEGVAILKQKGCSLNWAKPVNSC
jgi:histidinol-phosphatase (PHP family)